MTTTGSVDALKRQQSKPAAKLAALLDQTVEIDTSPFILSPFEAERKPTILDRAFIRLHVISVFAALRRDESAKQDGEL